MQKKITKYLNKDYIYILALILIIVLYFSRLFIPESKIFITPDIALSDQINLNYSLKKILADSLKKNQLPWWESRVANGFPLIGESQIGAFFLINLVIFKFLQFNFAFNLGYVLIFIIAAIGTYLYLKIFVRNKLVVFIASLFFTFSATMVLQITHYNLLQAYSLIPIIFFCLEKYLNKQNQKFWFFCLIFLLTQQFFAGYLGAFFITYFIIFLYMLLKSSFKKILVFFAQLSLILILTTSIQLFPMIRFMLQSTRNNGMGIGSIANSLTPSALMTYFNFYHFGSPSLGTYDEKIFFLVRNTIWDSNVYFGIVPFLFAVLAIIFTKDKKIRFFLLLSIISLLFSLGKYSPLYFIFILPGFNFFRTPVRFTIFLNFFLIALFAQVLNKIITKKRKLKPFIFILLTCSLINLIATGVNYHPIYKNTSLKNNQMSQVLLNQDKDDLLLNKYRIYQVGNENIWFRSMMEEGWKNINKYLFFQNDLGVFINTLFNIPSANLFYGSFYYPLQDYKYNRLIQQEFIKMTNPSGSKISIINYRLKDSKYLLDYFSKQHEFSLNFINLLKIKNVKYLITPINFNDNKEIKKIYESIGQFQIPYYLRLYEVNNPKPRFYLSNSSDGLISYNNILDPSSNLKKDYDLKLMQNDLKKMKLLVRSDSDAFLINTDSFDDDWKAYIDGKNTKILPVNINQRMISFPQGKHIIDFRYEPKWYWPCLILSFISNFIVLILTFKEAFKRSQ